jgi:hypothetical protein
MLLCYVNNSLAKELVLPGLDPMLKISDDPRLLGADRIIQRNHLKSLGVSFPSDDCRPTLLSLVRIRMHDKFRIDLDRMVEFGEISAFLGIVTTFRHPEFFFLEQSNYELPGGYVYTPARDVCNRDVSLFIDDIKIAAFRSLRVINITNIRTILNVNDGRGASGSSDGINLTIPIKLPKTLEKIIGRGDKTSIRISGREHISISGESSVSNRFTANERRQKPSLFPTLDMEQQLQISMSGQIGEKIHLEVDHNSEAIGPDGTKIRLTYEGTEDEVIQSIETGDVGLTLPGSQLLGYSSNKSGLFGVKVTGQVGRADFTVVASKQKAESASKSFNSKGGTVGDHVIEAYRYLNNRFFKLDLPSDSPGRHQANGKIDLSSLRIFRFVGTGRQLGGDVRYVVGVTDETGQWDETSHINEQLQNPSKYILGELWRPIDAEILQDQYGNLVAIDLLREYDYHDVLVATYTVVDATTEEVLYKVGDVAGEDEDLRWDGGDGQLYYRMKLLKPQNPEPYTWQYVIRNIYPLGGSNIDAESFDCRIEINMPTDFPDIDMDLQGNGSGLPWLRIFGLDRKNILGEDGADGLVDKNDPYLFDLQKGLLKFPLNFAYPFNEDPAYYTLLADSSAFNFDESLLAGNLIPEIYDPSTTESQMSSYTQFRIVATHAATSSSFNLGVSNLEEDSETVTLDGRTLTRDVDYTIDYMFGQITLKGEAASSLGADSQISVDYQYAPFMGGGNSTLLGLNMGYDLGRDNRFSTTWLYESTQVVGHKAKLGEEPSRNLVGNLNGQLTLRPNFLTSIANVLSRHNSDRESTVQITGELALSIPNPNTFDEAYVEDFEGIDSSDVMPTSRLSWSNASVPSHSPEQLWPNSEIANPELDGQKVFFTDGRVDTRWYLPKQNTLRKYLNPALIEQEGKETQQIIHLYMDSGDAEWGPKNWGGVMRGLGRNGIDLTKTQFIEFWVNDFQQEEANRTGTIHIDFGYINEDFYWPENEFSSIDTLTYQKEDDGDGVFTIDEDVGLGDNESVDRFSADYNNIDNPYPWINGTRGNNREDSEDLDGDTVFDRQDGFKTVAIDLADSALVDVAYDYDSFEVDGSINHNLAWRKYRIRLGDALEVSPSDGTGTSFSPSTVTHVRMWFEDRDSPAGTHRRDIQISELKFLGSRWEREGVRKVATPELPEEQRLSDNEIGVGEGFFIGEVNNKENAGYFPDFEVWKEHNIEEKEQSLVLDYQNLEQQHLVRASRLMSPKGDDYTQYERLIWYLYNPDQSQSEMDLFFRLGADTLNYYEVSYKFDQSSGLRTGWKEIRVDIAELSNAKLDYRNPETGWIETFINDPETNDEYRVRVVGAPDLRHIKRFYIGVVNKEHEIPQSGYFYFNDVRLRKVKRNIGVAERLGLRLNMADVIKIDLDWSKQDSDFHGLNADVGQGFTNENLNLSTNFKVNDFIPMLGFQLPITLGKQESTRRPKYLTNSDIEIIDDELRTSESTLDNRENFSIRLRRNPSRYAIIRYLLDPFNISLSGSRANTSSPLSRSSNTGLQGSVSYDLRIPGNYQLASLGPIKYIPLVRSIGLLPSKISLSGTFNNSERITENLSPVSGEFEQQPINQTKRGNLTGNFDYKPLPISDLSVTLRSERDMFRENKIAGINIGQENQFNQSLQLRLQPPAKIGLPDKWFTKPLRDGLRALQAVKPSITYNSSFNNNHGPNIRQANDPEGIRTVGSSGDWNIRATVPFNSLMNTWFPVSTGMSDADRKARIEREKKLNKRRNRRRGSGNSSSGSSSGTQSPEEQQANQSGVVLSDEERRVQEEEALLQAALEREAIEEEEKLVSGSNENSDDVDSEVVEEIDSGRNINIPNPLSPLLYVIRKSNPVQISYSIKEESNYGRILGDTPFWYKVGIWSELDLPDSLYATSSMSDRSTLSLSTSTKLGRWVTFDFKFNSTESGRLVAGSETRSTQNDWPDLRVSVGGIEKWRIFGGRDNDGLFRSSTIDMSFKKSKTVNGYTETVYNPKYTTVINPRWNMTFSNGMTTSLNCNISSDNMEQNGSLSQGNRINVGAQWRHSFSAERFLSKMGLYRPGTPPTVTMDVDLSYSKDTTDRWMPGTNREGEPDTQTGNTRMSINPRVSYQMTRSISGALRFLFSRDKIYESDTITTSLGIGVETTYVF